MHFLKKTFLTLFLAGLFSTAAQAEVLDINLNADAAQFTFYPVGSTYMEDNNAGLGLGLLYNEAGDFMLSGTFLVPSNSNSGLTLSPGFQANYYKLDGYDGNLNLALAIGGRASYLLPTTFPLSVFAEAFLAPAITSFDNIDEGREFGLGLEMQASDTSLVYAGFRKIGVSTDKENDSYDLDSRLHLGIKFLY